MTSPPSVPSGPRFAGAAVAGLVAVATLATLLGLACAPRHEAAPRSEPPPQRSFYYWRTVFRLSQAERAALQALQIRRLYVRLFDVTWDSAASAPTFVGDLTVDATEPAPEEIEFIPVVFLRHEVLQKLDEAGVRALSVELWRRIEERTALLPGLAGGAAASTPGAAASTRELQIDCDWTDGTRDRFFALLTELRRLGAASAARRATPAPRLSATIRLHQVKYRERTGVPPVERGMLMFYNICLLYTSDAADE